MNDQIVWFARINCSLAALAYAARMKRLGHSYFGLAVAALYTTSDDTKIVYEGRMPNAI